MRHVDHLLYDLVIAAHNPLFRKIVVEAAGFGCMFRNRTSLPPDTRRVATLTPAGVRTGSGRREGGTLNSNSELINYGLSDT